MSSVITTIENDAKAVVNTVSTDLSTEVARLEALLLKAKTTITTQAQTIASHVSAAATANTVVSQAAATLKAASDDFEKVLSSAAPVAAVAAVAVPLVVDTASLGTGANLVISTSNVGSNVVIQALDAAIHADPTANMATLHNLTALEDTYAKLMAGAGQSNAAAVPTPAHVAAIVQAAQTTSSGVLHRVESDVVSGASAVEAEAKKVISEVEAGVKDVAEGEATIGPLHI